MLPFATLLLAFPAAHDAVRDRWLQVASGTATAARLPSWTPFASLSGLDKWQMLHGPALAASTEGYVTPYAEEPIGALTLAGPRAATVEHVLPLSKVNGPLPGEAEDDPHGWIAVTRKMKLIRGELPLVLWDTGEGDTTRTPPCVETIGGELHFVPPLKQRARLARKWLYTRYQYMDVCDISPKSAAQQRHMPDIVELMRATPISPYERLVADALQATTGWSNPLLHADEAVRDSFLCDPDWLAVASVA